MQREVAYIKVVYYYSDEVWNNKAILEKVREEAHLKPFDGNIKFSDKMLGLGANIKSSLTENVLSMDFVI